MTRQYGTAPFRAAVVHGGPGGIGSAGGIAEGLSASCGVLEPLQSNYSIAELVAELHEQLAACSAPPLLVGHSWGAWLAALYAAEHPERVARLALVGCPPFEARYVPLIGARRLARLDEKERERFRFVLEELERTGSPALLDELGALCGKTDDFAPIAGLAEPPVEFDGDMYSRIWKEAAAMRESGELLHRISMLKTPVTVIHGEADPHPPEGVAEPLRAAEIPFDLHILPECGHTPWRETRAREAFFTILAGLLPQSPLRRRNSRGETPQRLRNSREK